MRVRDIAPVVIVAVGLFCSAAVADSERWHPATKAAAAITGEVVFDPAKVEFASGSKLPLEYVDEIPGFTWEDKTFSASLYRITEPGNPLLLRGDTLCGGSVRFISVTKTPDGIYLSAYYAKPRWIVEGICAGFQYLPDTGLR